MIIYKGTKLPMSSELGHYLHHAVQWLSILGPLIMGVQSWFE